MPAVTEAVRKNAKVVAVSGSLLGAAAAFSSHGVTFRPNRIAEGDSVSIAAGLGAWGWIVLALWVFAGVVVLLPLTLRVRGLIVTLAAGAAPVVLVAGCGSVARTYAAATGDIARTSLGWGVWISLFASYVVIFAATAWLRPGAMRAALTYLPVAGIVALIGSGALSELAIAREYANNADSFWSEFRLHLIYVAGAVLAGLVSGLLLGMLAARKRALEPLVFSALNVLQVLPTLAFIGLMNPVLTRWSEQSPLLARMGVRGVGWAPVIIVLSAYAVYPIARNTHTAIRSLDPGVIDAARGVGMGRVRRLAEVELPLALPVIIAGLRIALVQTTAGAIIAGLVGGGGLGTFVFLGAGETATDLILLGVLPIVALALFFDRSVLALEQTLGTGSARS